MVPVDKCLAPAANPVPAGGSFLSKIQSEGSYAFLSVSEALVCVRRLPKFGPRWQNWFVRRKSRPKRIKQLKVFLFSVQIFSPLSKCMRTASDSSPRSPSGGVATWMITVKRTCARGSRVRAI